MSDFYCPTFREMRERRYVLAWSTCLLCGDKSSCWVRPGEHGSPTTCYACYRKDPDAARAAVKSEWDAVKGGTSTRIHEDLPAERMDLPCEVCGARECMIHMEDREGDPATRIRACEGCWQAFYQGPLQDAWKDPQFCGTVREIRERWSLAHESKHW